ncbi:MAG: hypothetical protein A2941_01080 [Candidatus Yanofskybacteria bacterium RIFCSPLOWO2_01_FULL_49_17]|uniref:Uncharacterized protein n=1 Tax=Candidatus Yanofskybacteria bacterium RIFCSPLOWO2_01_FULL_49_17 TaxID=1802700 RepID=A0A1F8GPS0_9BACT|nr:MAG: hypothetical protein A2941_01080 [Candidatus Yanofskybacteria bacterium RIFCSPLOWO2_01_FULL_49_17]
MKFLKFFDRKLNNSPEDEIVKELANPELDSLANKFFELNYHLSGMIYDGQRETPEYEAQNKELDVIKKREHEIALYAIKKGLKLKEKGVAWNHSWHWFIKPEYIREILPNLTKPEHVALIDEVTDRLSAEIRGLEIVKQRQIELLESLHPEAKTYMAVLDILFPDASSGSKIKIEEIRTLYSQALNKPS